MCSTSNFCSLVCGFPCVLKQKYYAFLKRFSAILSLTLSQVGAFFLIEAESFQFSKRGELCSSYPYRTSIRAKRPETKKRRFARSLRRWCRPVM
ncbi:hypothetical protein CU632_11075 [Escherichia coli]|nr:hypothetical protein CQP61_10105 [Escherichia coli]MBM0537528.1 hypothetical protein [Escherichia coli]MCH7176820.1 hypothetical protein [Escherichia coli]MDI4413113.1 hypothetical protein [Escherichia coli]NBH57366.1 hypothetical protein [Escherichia coli]